ncbi:collagenase [Parashewanella spongiae]|uniref:Collagenase n=2 Tax=Parashewanella spongiae TaxID=342950 RepID=A0A3A6U0L7_9GAMM|nr:collagenase [Parashewanella spongiae]
MTILAVICLGACNSTPPTNTPNKIDHLAIQSVIQLEPQDLFSAEQPLLKPDTFDQVLLALNTKSSIADINHLLYYLRAYSYFGPQKELTETQRRQLASQLVLLAQDTNINTNPRFQEQLAVTVYRYLNKDEYASSLTSLFPVLSRQLAHLQNSDITNINDIALWETLRTYGLLLNVARTKPEGELAKLLIEHRVDKPLLRFAASTNSIRNNNDWPRLNAYWALAMYRLTLPSSTDGSTTQQEQAIDDGIAKIATADVALRQQAAQDAFTLGYHVNTSAGKKLCEDNASLCRIPELTSVLPHRHDCSMTLFITHQDLSKSELEESCTKLTSQEFYFHQLLESQLQPTANDNSDALEVVVFKNWSQYNAYGQLFYDIRTNNGGMYLEGTPQKVGNQARFFAFRQWWIEPKFAIWNLNHEYVHYLDGRFVKYGKFGHFPDSMVWWSEGLAEYVSKGDENQKAFKVAHENFEKAPDLATIFATTYKDGLDRTYKWSYLAVRYLAEKHPADLVQLSQYLKGDYFTGYKDLLKALSAHQEDYHLWLTALLKQHPLPKEKTNSRLYKQDRYSYRDYLTPDHLVFGEQHKHY